MSYVKTTWVNDSTPLNADNMNNIENGIEQNESDIANINSSIPALTGASAPTTSTEGRVGQLYLNTTTPALYMCAAITPQGTDPETYTYTWTAISSL